MDIPTTMTPIQLLLIWLIMGLLVTWMIVFALLALKPERTKKFEPEHRSSSNSPFPQLHVVVQEQTMNSATNREFEPTTVSTSHVTR